MRWAVCLFLAGCATNGISVSETTPDGGTLVVDQKTLSSWGARTQEGAGNFRYSATAVDGSQFDMRAGASVTGQETPDPTTALLGVIQALVPVPAAPEPPRAREQALSADQIAQITELIDMLITRRRVGL